MIMGNYEQLKQAISNVIKQNGNQEITGQLLQNVLNNIVSSVGENSTFVGIATPATNPGVPDGNVFYLATEAGTYSNFNGIEIASGEAVILEWRGSWTKKISGFATEEKAKELDDKYKSLTIHNQLVGNVLTSDFDKDNYDSYTYNSSPLGTGRFIGQKIIRSSITNSLLINSVSAAKSQIIIVNSNYKILYNNYHDLQKGINYIELNQDVAVDNNCYIGVNTSIKYGKYGSIHDDNKSFSIISISSLGASENSIKTDTDVTRLYLVALNKGSIINNITKNLEDCQSDINYIKTLVGQEKLNYQLEKGITEYPIQLIPKGTKIKIKTVVSDTESAFVYVLLRDSSGASSFFNQDLLKNNIVDITLEKDLKIIAFNVDASVSVELTLIQNGIISDIFNLNNSGYNRINLTTKSYVSDTSDCINNWSKNSEKRAFLAVNGYSNKFAIKKYFCIDNRRMTIHCQPGNGNVIYAGFFQNSTSSSQYGSIISVHFESSQIKVYEEIRAEITSYTELVEASSKSINIDDNYTDYEYLIHIERINNWGTKITVYNVTLQKLCGEFSFIEYKDGKPYPKQGFMYGYPVIWTDGGTPSYINRISITALSFIELFLLIVGDSITEGYGSYTYENTWSRIFAGIVGKSIVSARSGGTLDILSKIEISEIPYIKPRNILIAFGHNDVWGITDFSSFKTSLQNRIDALKAMKINVYLACMPRTTDPKVDSSGANNIILKVADENDIQVVRFDIATSIDNDLTKGVDTSLFFDDAHPNELGYKKMSDRAKLDLAELVE